MSTQLEPHSHPPKTQAVDKVPIHEKSLYGLGNPALGMTTQIVDYNSKQVLVYSMGLSPSIFSLSVMVFRLWDAFTDPLMGWISDRTRSCWGRRRPYMVAGCLLMALILPFVYRFNEGWPHWLIAAWFIGFGILMSTATTIYNIPFQTLKLEMSPDYNERTSINAYSSIVVKLFAFVGPWIWAMTQLPFFTGQAAGEEPNSLLGIRNVALYFAVFIIVLGLIPPLVCKERYYAQASTQRKEPFWESFKLTMKNRPFRYLIVLILVMNVEGLIMGMGGFLMVYYACGGDTILAAKISGTGGSLSGVLGLFSIPLFSWIANRYGKEKSLFVVVAAGGLLALGVLVFYNPAMPWLVVIPMSLGGPFLTGLWVVLPSMQADVVDHDELATHERREGSYSSVFSWLLKFAGTLFYGLSGPLVEMVGFDIALGENQAGGVFLRMKLLMVSIPVVLALIKCWIILKWPLTSDVMVDIRQQLEARRGSIN